MADSPPRFGIVGWKNSGKTTMTANLTRELIDRGHRVATVKRAHGAFDIDRPGTDSHTHRQAGAQEVAIVSSARWALIHENRPDEAEVPLDDIIARLSPCDIVLVEGFKGAPHPKIELRANHDKARPALADADPAVVAVACDDAPGDVAPDGKPVFRRDQTEAIATLVEQVCGLGTGTERRSAS
ncbi:molybdopterin-guanine dinucleotide biosynthesis protein B [Oceaniradius stylonematis]|jgi:molybdopterin-guanine dinucleotide biosynthesis protein B|uniref:molybdopterin-guanine dinucleotide biosynthesis protein B n=1 Tax=Oceaniradius stylonematis TaxID=2184161 RepID=UPI00273FAE8B|nr:molybdopterin-guanine dinucleotide biosynthesis protein B [Oceaniradius stylonematis]